MWGGLSLASLGDQVCAVVLSWSGAKLLGTASGYLAATQAMGMMQTVVPGIVARAEDLPAANAMIDTSERLARLLGPTIVGLASAAVSLTAFVACAAVGFAVSAGTTWAIIRATPERLAAASRQGVVKAVTTGFAVLRPQGLLWFMLWVNMVINGAWFGAFFVGLPLIVERSGVVVPGGGGGGLAVYGLVMAGYGGANLLSTLMMGGLGVRGMSARMIFRGNFLLGGGIVVLGLAGHFVAGPLLFALLVAGAAISAVGGPMQDITVATLRQMLVPRRDMGAAVRAFMLVNQTGSLLAMLAAPSAFEAIGIAPAVVVCGVAIIAVGLVGMRRFGGGGATRTVQAGPL